MSTIFKNIDPDFLFVGIELLYDRNRYLPLKFRKDSRSMPFSWEAKAFRFVHHFILTQPGGMTRFVFEGVLSGLEPHLNMFALGLVKNVLVGIFGAFRISGNRMALQTHA